MCPIVEHNGKEFEVDYDGYRVRFDIQPDEDWYDYVRIQEGLPEITSEQRELLEYIYIYFSRNGLAPMRRTIYKETNKSPDCISKLFPTKNPFKTVCIMAGLPMPIS
jgi:sulfur relay (sulfurtransferase) DsrC/TusE family protein